MTGVSMTKIQHGDRTSRTKRLLYRSARRGTQEMDLLLGGFVRSVLAEAESISAAQLNALEELINESDADLYSWLSGRTPVPTSKNNPMLQALLESCG